MLLSQWHQTTCVSISTSWSYTAFCTSIYYTTFKISEHNNQWASLEEYWLILLLSNYFSVFYLGLNWLNPFPTNMSKYDPGILEEALFNVIIYCPLHLQSIMQKLFTLKRTCVYFLATRDSLRQPWSYWKQNIIPHF